MHRLIMSNLDVIVVKLLSIHDHKWHINESRLYKLLNLVDTNDKRNEEVLD